MKKVFVCEKLINQSLTSDTVYTINQCLNNVNNDTIITFEKANYELKTKYAFEKLCYISNNDHSVKNIAFYLEGKENIVIDGNGSHLNCIGRIVPFYLKNCKNITIKNFSIDYSRPFTSQGEITEVGDDYAVLKIDQNEFPYEIKNGTIRFIGEDYYSTEVHGLLEFDYKEKRPVANVFDNSVKGGVSAVELEKGIVKILYPFTHIPKVGNILTLKHDHRIVSSISIDTCDTVKIENVWLKQGGSMGVVAQLSKNIHLDKFDIYPDPNSQRVFSINADATHFVNCYGDVIVENGRFESMFDDIINVHGNYLRVDKVINNTQLIAEIPHFQQKGFINIFTGSKIAICDSKTMFELGYSTVKSCEKINNHFFVVTLENDFNFENDKNYCIDSIDLYPKVYFRNNHCGKNRARGLLFTSKKETIVENNYIDSEGSCIKVNSDMKNWYESSSISTIIVRNNTLMRKNHVNWGTAIIDIDPAMQTQVEGKYFHGDMIIENNKIVLDGTPLFYGYSFTNLVVRNNEIYAIDKYSAENVIETSNCSAVTFENNKFMKLL